MRYGGFFLFLLGRTKRFAANRNGLVIGRSFNHQDSVRAVSTLIPFDRYIVLGERILRRGFPVCLVIRNRAGYYLIDTRNNRSLK